MTVKEAYANVHNLQSIAKNLRLLHQYFLNQPKEQIQEIEETHGMSMPLKNALEAAELYLTQDAEQLTERIENTEIEIP